MSRLTIDLKDVDSFLSEEVQKNISSGDDVVSFENPTDITVSEQDGFSTPPQIEHQPPNEDNETDQPEEQQVDYDELISSLESDMKDLETDIQTTKNTIRNKNVLRNTSRDNHEKQYLAIATRDLEQRLKDKNERLQNKETRLTRAREDKMIYAKAPSVTGRVELGMAAESRMRNEINKLIKEMHPINRVPKQRAIRKKKIVKAPPVARRKVPPRRMEPVPPVTPGYQPRVTKVKFDKTTDAPWTVAFSERGFSIGETRLSFEILGIALSKGFNIKLDSGHGMELDQVKMQKIMKYKGRF